jgi:transglutaminase-like putative cysteine protease
MLVVMTQTDRTRTVHEDEQAYYAEPGPMTTLELSPQAAEGLPADPLGLCGVARGVIVHEFLAASLYGVEIPPARADEVETRPAAAIVDTIQALDGRPLAQARPAERRMFGNCRQFSTLTCGLLRRAGIPARARCGFGTYFEDGKYIDHWIVEYWDPARDGWRRVDSQIDQAQREMLAIDFDATDVPPDKFLAGGDAWQLCRDGRADPERFGILDFWGAWFVRANVVRDLAALNKMELLPWDGWGLMTGVDEIGEVTADRLTDDVATTTVAGDWRDVRRLYEGNEQLRVPATVMSYRANASVTL